MRNKKRNVVLESFPEKIPAEVEFLYQDKSGFVFRASPRAAESLKSDAVFVSGSMKKIKTRAKGLNPRPNI